MTRNEAAERLHHLVVTEAGSLRSPAIAEVIREALATERRLTVEQIRLDVRLSAMAANKWPLDELNRILDEIATADVDEDPTPEQPRLINEPMALAAALRSADGVADRDTDDYIHAVVESLHQNRWHLRFEAQARPEQDEAVRHDCTPSDQVKWCSAHASPWPWGWDRCETATPPPATPAALDVEEALRKAYPIGISGTERSAFTRGWQARGLAFTRLTTPEAEPLDLEQLQQDGAQE